MTKRATYKGLAIREFPFAPGRKPPDPTTEFFEDTTAMILRRTSTEFVGVTANGKVDPGLFPVKDTGISTAPIVSAAQGFLETLDAAQRATVTFDIDAPEWRRWLYWAPYLVRHGLMLEQLKPRQLEAALTLMREALGERGFNTARDMMRINENLAEITERRDEFGEWIYWISIFGTPSADQPWGWQLDGHHLIINYFVLGDQVVMSPVFMGAEPLKVEIGKYADADIAVFGNEERYGLDLVRSLNSTQKNKAVLFPSAFPKDLPADRVRGSDTHICAGAFNDNLVLPYDGISADSLSAGQREQLLKLVEAYVGNLRPGHSNLRMAEIKQKLDGLRFAWIGGTGDSDPFYYRIHSPMVLIEFDHHPGYGFVHENPYKMHVHTIMRTPNGNDYGRALLRAHRDRANAFSDGPRRV